MDGCTWTAYNRSMHESSLVFAANDSDGSIVVVGRAHHNGDLIPGKVLVRHGKIHISYNSQELSLPNFEVLINSGGFTWQASSNGHVPAHAVVGGKTASGETLYVGRAQHGGRSVPGKVHPSHRCLYLPSDWKEHAKTNYEVLVRAPGGGHYLAPGGGINQGWVTGPEMLPPHGGVPVFPQPFGSGVQWVNWTTGQPWPHNAVVGGVYKEGGARQEQFIARKRHQASLLLGYAYRNGPFYAGWHGGEICHADFELLIDNANAFPKEIL